MYPEHWFLLDDSKDNFGFSMRYPLSVGEYGDLEVQSELGHTEFSVTMDCCFAGDSYTTMQVPLNGDQIQAFEYTNSSNDPKFEIDQNRQAFAIRPYLVSDENSNSITNAGRVFHCPRLENNRFYHISILYYDGKTDLYINGVLCEYEVLAARYTPYTNYRHDASLFAIRDAGIGSSNITKNVKYYNTKISKQQILEDYYHMCAHYLFDGSGIVEEDCRTECDTSGGTSYDAHLQGSPDLQLELTSTGNHLRDYSVSIPIGGGIWFPTPPNESFFINFWVYFVAGDSNFSLFKKSALSLSGMVEDVGYSLHYGVSSEEAQVSLGQISVSTWYMISIGYDPVDGDGDLHVYINGNGVVDVAVDSSTVDLIGDGSAIMYAFPGVLSDYKQYLHIPSDAEILRMYTGEVAIDDRGTFYASKLTEDETMSTFGFTRGEIRAKGFELLEEEDSSTAKFDINSGVFKVRDFKQI